MKLRRLRLQGFKTFARPTVIDFVDGMTAIVGPNGSGKSNVVDAIRWALGETRARELRGARMDDVIFAGGEGKSPLGMASVEVTLDLDGSEAVHVEGTELQIGRRVERSGPSEYRVNSKRTRLRDIDRLLASTGLRQSGYAIVAQSDVDSIIHATPLQRRALVEEAAGTRALRADRDDALRRLDRGDEAVDLLATAIAEMEPRCAELEAQAVVAIGQREMTGRLAELRGSLAQEQWRSVMGEVRRTRNRLARLASQMEQREGERGAALVEWDKAKEAAASCRRAIEEMSKEVEEARLVATRTEGDLMRGRDSAAAYATQLALTLDEVANLGRGVEERTAAAARLVLEREQLLASIDQTAHGREERLARASEARAQLTSATAALDEASAAMARSLAVSEGFAHEQERVRNRAEELVSIGETARTRRDALQGTLDTRQNALDDLRIEATALWAALTDERTAADSAAEEVGRAVTTQTEITRALHEASSALAQADAKCKSLLGQRDALTTQSRGQDEGQQLVADLLPSVDEATAVAVEAALDNWLHATVLDDDTQVDVTAASPTSGRQAYVVGETRVDVTGELALLGEPLLTDDLMVRLDSRLIHLVANVRRVDNRDAARRVAQLGGVAVLPSGERWSREGCRVGGEVGAELVIRAAYEVARGEYEASKVEVERCGLLSHDADVAVASWREAVASRDAAAQAAAQRAGRASEELAKAEQDMASVISEHARVSSSLDDVAAERAILGTREREIEVGLTNAKQRSAQLKVQRDTAMARRDEMADLLASCEKELREIDETCASGRIRVGDVERRITAEHEAIHAVDDRKRRLVERLRATELDAIAASFHHSVTQTALRQGRDRLEEAKARAIDVTAPREALEEAVAQCGSAVAAFDVELARARQEHEAVGGELSALEERAAQWGEALSDDESGDDVPTPDDIRKTEREILVLERSIGDLGPVNALAPEQLEKEARQLGDKRSYHDDIDAAIDHLRGISGELEAVMDERFASVFDAVSASYSELFEELFPGGRANLVMESIAPRVVDDEASEENSRREDNIVPLRGIEVIVAPAGKRAHPLVQLSGGERALAALALVFALQKVNPSPFYLFDEVDAALDEANVGRLARIMKRLATEQQMVVITHTQTTMSAAGALYGVSINGSGVSDVVSVRLPEAEAAVAS